MKDLKFNFEVEGKVYELVFNLNVMEEIQDEYGTIDKWGSLTDGVAGEPNAKALIFGLTAMMNEAIDIENEELEVRKPFLTKKQVGRLISKVGLKESAKKLNDAVVESTKSEEKNA